MNIPPSAVLLIVVSLCGAALALAAFVWAVRTGQLDQTNAGGLVIFDEEEPAGVPTGPTFPPEKKGEC
jgi:cbb3-type cytochrome oxidase maturation protein